MQNDSLKKSITTIEAMAIVVGMIIGSGIFLKPGIVLTNAGSPFMSIVAWVAGGIITLAAALSVAEIAAAIPKSGGLYTYLSNTYGNLTGFLLGWVQTIVSYPASVGALAIAFATYSGFFVSLNPMQEKLLAVAALLFILIMNIISTKFGGIIQVLATVGKLIPIVAIILFGLLSDVAPVSSSIQAPLAGAGFGAAILGTLWAYDGWISVTNMAGELNNPSKTLPRVITFGVIFVIIVYAAFNLTIFHVLPVETIATSAIPGSDAAEAIFGKSGGVFITAGIMISVFGALNGYLMTAARVPYVMGQEKKLPFSGFLGKIHPKLGTPANALIVESLLSVVYIFTGTFNTLTDLLIFVLWIFFTMGVFAVFILRKNTPYEKGNYRVPLYPLTPIVGVIGGVYILGSTLLNDPIRSCIGIGITLLGIPVYYFIQKR
ncbi:APC family permease [Clostridium aminobutyricum]|uniref:Amino acid permease n=1 Tax=Clostridium aminobutyricum TaxID=33953 RepID=A0A939IGU2_CLOAM|nr:amino acid permease [Clostridium aminobutyricum]MBN7773920.1 amino acid permease [Clostridium aminobutyricum]